MMRIPLATLLFFAFIVSIISCSRKHHTVAANTTDKKNGANATVKKVPRRPTPAIITVDDRAAKKTPDGRLYYDFEKKRYWKNYDDGKYYLFSKTMYSNPAFVPH